MGFLDNVKKNNLKIEKSEIDIESSEIISVEINKILEHKNNIFKPYDDEKLNELVESINENGLFSPVLLKLNEDDTYTILSGHNRVNAYRKLGLSTIESIVKYNLNEDEENLIVVNSNLIQRDKLLPSEKAKAYKIQLDALKKLSKNDEKIEVNRLKMEENSDLSHDGTKERLVEKNIKDNKTNIYRYIRLNYLSKSILNLVDDEIIAITVAVELSYLNEKEQEIVHNYFYKTEDTTKFTNQLNLPRVKAIRELVKEKELSKEALDRLFKKIDNPKKFTSIKIATKKINKVINRNFNSQDEAENYILEAIKFYEELNKNK